MIILLKEQFGGGMMLRATSIRATGCFKRSARGDAVGTAPSYDDENTIIVA